MSTETNDVNLPGPGELPELAAALRGLDDTGVPRVPAAVDKAVRDAARAHFAPRPQPRLLPWISLAAAASIAVAAGVWAWGGAERDPASGLTAAKAKQGSPNAAPIPPAQITEEAKPVAGDVNADGTLDIIDAYLLARLVQRREAGAPDGTATNPAWDRNGDGAIDAADADAIALAAVALNE